MNTPVKRKPGVKTEPLDGPVARRTITVDELTWRRLLVVGKGNASHGIRESARIAYDRYQHSKD